MLFSSFTAMLLKNVSPMHQDRIELLSLMKFAVMCMYLRLFILFHVIYYVRFSIAFGFIYSKEFQYEI